MFTGLIEKIGTIRRVSRGRGLVLEIGFSPWAEPLAKGESVAVDGVCLTVVDCDRTRFTAHVLGETERRSTMAALPPGAKVPLFGPTENVETQKLVIAGLTTKETPVVSLMESLESGFETLVTSERKINSFKQDNAEMDGRKLLSFEVEYTMPARRFAK